MIRRLLPLTLAMTLVGCMPTPQAAEIPQETVLTNDGNRYVDLSGRVVTASGGGAASELMLFDEYGKPVAEAVPTKSNATGAFTFSRVLQGTYFAKATHADGTSHEGLITTQAYYNPVSPAASLTAAFVRQLLEKHLIFIEDLPVQTLAGITFELEPLIADRVPPVEADATGRRNQFGEFRNKTALLTRLSQELEDIAANRAKLNLVTRPPYASAAEYDEKKKKLGL